MRGDTSTRARALHAEHPELSASQIAEELGCSRQLVQAALRATRTAGRPSADGLVPRTVRLRPEIDQLARAEAERDGISVHDVLVRAIESGLLPEGEWLEYQRRKRTGYGAPSTRAASVTERQKPPPA